jgi:hypothetical protein
MPCYETDGLGELELQTKSDFFLWGYVKEQPLPLDIDELKLRITAAIETIDRNMYGMSWIRDWTSVGSQTELTLSIFRVFKTS